MIRKLKSNVAFPIRAHQLLGTSIIWILGLKYRAVSSIFFTLEKEAKCMGLIVNE